MRIAIVITARPSYAKAKTVIAALVARGVDVQIICAASALLERYGNVKAVIESDFPQCQITECWTTYEGATLLTSAKETGALLTEMAVVLRRMRPMSVLCVADRHEVLAAAQAAAYLHLRVVHVQGGERSGSIDDKVRDAVTQLADVHMVATERAKHRVYALTGDWDAIHHVGCPSIDLAKQAQTEAPVTLQELGGTGAQLDLTQPFVVVLQHPVTQEAACAAPQLECTLVATVATGLPAVVFWPGQDAGSEAMSKTLRQWGKRVHAVRNLPPSRFMRLLTQAACLVGNSSAGIREGSYLGVPVVNIGTRQHGRERGPNVVDLPVDGNLTKAILAQCAHGQYQSSALYGRGDAGERSAEVLVKRRDVTFSKAPFPV